ncbi:MAG: O-acetylhomoserine aminocarboxypropyltransferase/cysteine synthase [Kiritimatiellae bacterium]|nr:O-acetylhomoserine aminocarboxypropyltransferase/cysteine synthase [Kiritimatiellia bacterium]
MSENKKLHAETLALHEGWNGDPATHSCAVPVYRTTAYNFDNAQYGADLFALKRPGNIYARLMNPTEDVLEKRLAALEGGIAALTLASGTAAIYFTVTNIAETGANFVSADNVYGGTYVQFNTILPQSNNIKVRWTHLNDFAAVEAAIDEKTRFVYVETIGNPALGVADIEGYAKVAHKHGLPLVVDATFSTPILEHPIAWGADIVIHSLSKWIGGHGAGIGGVVIDAGKFDWTQKGNPLYVEPDTGYHGIKWGEAIGAAAFITRLRTVALRNQGPTLSPDANWIFLQGVESLPLRIARHSENALAVAKYLQSHPKVAWVRYPTLSDPELAAKYLPNGAGGMVVFGVKGGAAAGVKVADGLKLFTQLANVGDARSLVIHPASSTHSQLSEQEQKDAGLPPELIRLSIGIEHIDDIIADLEQALAQV